MTITQTDSAHKLTLPNFDFEVSDRLQPLLNMLEQQKQAINTIATQAEAPTWENTLAPLEKLDDELGQFWSPVSHLHGVQNTEAVRDLYDQAIAPLSQFYSEYAHHQPLYQRIKQLKESAEYAQLSIAQKKVIDNSLQTFELSGVHLDADNKKKVAGLLEKISKLSTDFSNHVLDATQAWFYHTNNEADLDGLPEHMKALAQQAAIRKELQGWVITLDAPNYIAAMTYLKDRAIRETLYQAYTSRASDQGPNANTYDNTAIMLEIVKTRQQLAQLLGFTNFADYNLQKKMADSPAQVLSFLQDLLAKAKPKAEQELKVLQTFAHELDGLDILKPWDTAYYSELLQQKLYQISDEQLRPYFECNRVLQGLFDIAEKLYHIVVKLYEGEFKTWHDDVKTYAIYDKNNQLISLFIIDLFARELKRPGAWMDEAISRRQITAKQHQIPIAFLTCNFAPASNDEPSLLTHQEVITLFHEFGHCLQHMLTTVKAADVAGISGVPWDAVELPSQFMENWAWEKESLDLFAKHYQTDEAIPEAWLTNMKASQQFQGALRLCRQLQFAIFDMRLHCEAHDLSNKEVINKLLDEVRQATSVMDIPEYNRFAHCFSHIFAGGYAAGYYSYLWAELMSADAFESFEQLGLFNQEKAQAFKQHILEAGGSVDADEAYRRFKGHDAQSDALLRGYGVS